MFLALTMKTVTSILMRVVWSNNLLQLATKWRGR